MDDPYCTNCASCALRMSRTLRNFLKAVKLFGQTDNTIFLIYRKSSNFSRAAKRVFGLPKTEVQLHELRPPRVTDTVLVAPSKTHCLSRRGLSWDHSSEAACGLSCPWRVLLTYLRGRKKRDNQLVVEITGRRSEKDAICSVKSHPVIPWLLYHKRIEFQCFEALDYSPWSSRSRRPTFKVTNKKAFPTEQISGNFTASDTFSMN